MILAGDDMADTIEAFVKKLKLEGVDQGKHEAQRLIADAQQQSEEILADARAKAEKIIADANAEADGTLARSRTELELATRDATLKLRESLEKILEAVLLNQVGYQLDDSQFLKELIQSIVQRYIDADIDSYAPVKINVEPQMRQQLCDWAIGKLRLDTKNDAGGFDFQDNLRQAGFEFSLHGATIEITQESVVETLMQLVSPSLREVIRQANQSEGGA